ncbi:LysE/ArgO family amino acid transporter [Leuconostoc pseudomesenteroides]|uniref:LysE/ArgO family amino acid transporter n=1 Tax=Leuconostoc pseudomesenteroides TaxID=33968 RepID=UPI0032DE97AE
MFYNGLLLGFALVAPIGMQNLYVFNNALNNRLRRAYLYSMFIWIANSAFVLFAYFGFGTLVSKYLLLKFIVMLVGSFLVIWMGAVVLRTSQAVQLQDEHNGMTVKKALTSALIVSWANPQAIIDGSITLSAFRGTLNTHEVWPFVLGIMAATFIWFNAVTLIINLLKMRLPQKILFWFNVISGCVLIGYGFYLMYELYQLIV